jgi:hypothetical protein
MLLYLYMKFSYRDVHLYMMFSYGDVQDVRLHQRALVQLHKCIIEGPIVGCLDGSLRMFVFPDLQMDRALEGLSHAMSTSTNIQDKLKGGCSACLW